MIDSEFKLIQVSHIIYTCTQEVTSAGYSYKVPYEFLNWLFYDWLTQVNQWQRKLMNLALYVTNHACIIIPNWHMFPPGEFTVVFTSWKFNDLYRLTLKHTIIDRVKFTGTRHHNHNSISVSMSLACMHKLSVWNWNSKIKHPAIAS